MTLAQKKENDNQSLFHLAEEGFSANVLPICIHPIRSVPEAILLPAMHEETDSLGPWVLNGSRLSWW
jgi:hypothetical protein